MYIPRRIQMKTQRVAKQVQVRARIHIRRRGVMLVAIVHRTRRRRKGSATVAKGMQKKIMTREHDGYSPETGGKDECSESH